MIKTFGLLYEPAAAWQEINNDNQSVIAIYFRFVLLVALIPPLAAFIGATYVGWSIGSREVMKLTSASALQLSISAYLAILLGVYLLSQFIYWMAITYGAKVSINKCFALASYSCFPLFLVSLVSVYPILWLDMLLTLAGIALAVRLLYLGTPIMMGIDQDRGFLFASSILTVGMVMTVGVLAVTVIFWGSGIAPEYTR